MESADKDQGKKNIPQVQTFTVPFALGEIKENITFNTNKPSKPSREQIINQAFKYHSQGNISEAAKYYQFFINQGLKDHRVYSNFGAILDGLGKLKEAELSYRKAIELKPDFAEAHLNLGIVLKNLDKLKEAELSYHKAIEINPNLSEAHSNLGTVLNNLGKLKEAELSLRKAIELKPDFAEAYLNLGNTLRGLGKLKEAELSLRKAMEIKPDFAESHFNLGIILKDIGKLKEAEISLRKAIEIKPDFAMALSNLGIILKDLGKLQEAELSYRKAIEIKPDHAEAHSNLGSILQDLGKNKEALRHWIKSAELKPENEQLVKTLAMNLCFKKKYDLALKYLSQNKSNSCQILYLGCLLSLDREKEFTEKYQELSQKKVCDANIGGIVEHANIIYEKTYDSLFCNEAIKYVLIDKINEESFSQNDLNKLIAYTHNPKTRMKAQGTLQGGVQTSGDLFSLDLPFIKSVKEALEEKIELYKNKFKDSGQGFINNWPKDYELRSWMISMKSGGFLAPHNHEYGWITGSFYLQIPKYNDNNKDAGNLAFSYQGPRYPKKDKDFNLTIQKIETRDICIFPSSLFHHTIPFKSTEERICFVFDLVQK